MEQQFAEARRYRVESLQIALEIGWQEQCAALLGDFAMLDCDEGNTERAAVLCGASITQRKKLGVFPYPRKERVADVQAVLGSATFEKLFAEGEQLSLSQAIALATEKIPELSYSVPRVIT